MRFSCNHYQIMNNQLVKISKWILGNTLYNKPIFFSSFCRFQYLFNFLFFLSINSFLIITTRRRYIFKNDDRSLFFTYDLKRKKIKLARINFKLFEILKIIFYNFGETTMIFRYIIAALCTITLCIVLHNFLLAYLWHLSLQWAR